MSVDLQHPNKCAKCGRLMKAGTQVDFFKDGNTYVYMHAGDCDEAAKAAAPTPKFRPRIEVRECSNTGLCSYGTGVGFRGTAPSRCPLCDSLWLDLEAVA